jgi:prepilin-type N-terminal cleavage/methylation domain-containing protein
MAGFTLIEILVVVAIVAMLGAIAVPNFLAMRDKAVFNDTIVILRKLSARIDLFAMEKDRYPDTLAEAGLETIKDEWGNDFIYNPFHIAAKKDLRKFKNLQPINDDYVLFLPAAHFQ